MITTLKIENLKGITARLDLGKATAIVGPNYSGKTAIGDALRLALTGEHPELGKANAAIFKLCSGTELRVAAFDDSGRNVERTWTLKGKTVKATTAGDLELPAFLMDTGLFLRANAKDRLRMVASGAGDAEETAAARLAAELGATAETFEAMEKLAEEFEGTAKEQKAIAKRFLGMLEGTTLVDAEKAPPARPDVAGAQARALAAFDALKQARQVVTDLGKRQRDGEEAMGKLKGIPEDVDTLIAKIADLEEKRALVESTGASAKMRAAELAGTVSRLQVTMETLVKMHPRAIEPTEQLAAEIDRLEALEPFTNADWQKLCGEVTDANLKLNIAKGKLAAATEAVEKAEAELAKIEEMECCPTCMAANDGWKNAVRQSLQLAVGAAAAEKVTATAQVERFNATLADLIPERDRVEGILRDREKLPALQNTLTAALQLADITRRQKEAEDLHDRLAQSAAGSAEVLMNLRNQLAAARMALQSAQGVEHLRALVAGMPTEQDHDHADRAVMEAEEALEAANAAQVAAQAADREHAAAMEREANIREAREKADEAEAKAADATAKAKTTRLIMQEEMASAFNAVATAADTFSTAVLGGKLVVEDGAIGRWIGATFVPFDVLSGAEQVVATIALQVGLQGGRGALVMIDEVSRVDVKRKVELAKVLVASIEDGTIDQALVFDHDAAFWTTTGFETITPSDLPK